MPHRRARKPRGSRGVRNTPCIRDGRQQPYYDLMVVLPKLSAASEKTHSQLLMKQCAERLASTGYSTLAFAHTVFGRPRANEDDVESILQLPASFSTRSASDTSKTETYSKREAKRSRSEKPVPIHICKRLHAVVENLSDVGVYTRTDASENAATLALLQGYDLVSLAPCNDATFQAACCASEADIVTLDYTAGRGGVQLPFRIRPSDVRAVVQREAAFELHYAPALLNVNQRKALVQTARMLQMASVGIRPPPRILFSSGNRNVMGDSDTGAMALRSPGDLINLLQAVLGMDASTAHDALGATGTSILERGRLRRLGLLGRREVVTVYTEADVAESDEISQAPLLGAMESKPNKSSDQDLPKEEDGDVEDGFITL